MKRIIYIFFISLWALKTLNAQTVTNVVAVQNGNTIEIKYDLDQLANIVLLMSKDGGRNFSIEPQTMLGDVGNNITAGHKRIIWNWKCDGINQNLYNVCFKVIAKNIEQQSHRSFQVHGVSFTMIKVDGGTYTMGATSEQGNEAESNEKPRHKVTLSDYYIGQTEVTQELWQAVMGNTIQQQRDKESRSFPLKGVGKDYPMYYISWYECHLFINALNSELRPQLGGKEFALPTEAQWEFAARGGTQSNNYKYSGSNNIEDVSWYGSNARSSSHPVKLKAANELGIYDMSGNVWEWCEDWYGEYKVVGQTNPKGPSAGRSYVLRGGSWFNGASSARVTCRVHDPGKRKFEIGLRLVLQ